MYGEKYEPVYIYIKDKKQKTEIWVGRCAICGTVIRARNYQDFRKKLKRHTKKCLKKGI